MSGCRSANQEVIDANLWPKKDYWEDGSSAGHVRTVVSVCVDELKLSDNLDHKDKTVTKDGCIAPVQFTFHELAAATKNFCTNCFMGEGDFGNIYRGHLERTGQVVFVQKLYGNFDQGVRDFSMEVLKLSLYRHENLVNLIGYCADRGHHLLVREFMTLTSLEHHLHYLLPNQEPLDWNTRMKIALGVAKGLEYLHNTANPPVVYGDLKPSNILLDQRHGYHPKLSNLKLGKHTPFDNITSHSSYQAAVTYTYCDPEGPLSFHSDVYSFGLIFLELITGRKPIDYNRPPQERYLVYWARPLLKEMRNYRKMADPMLQGRYPPKRLKQALSIASMCMHEAIAKRPNIHSVVAALIDVASQTSAHPDTKTVTDDVVAGLHLTE